MKCVGCGCTEARACEGGCAWRPGFAAVDIALCTRCGLAITFPIPPNLANGRVHWSKKHKDHGIWRARALASEPWLAGRRPRRPLPVLITAQTTLVLWQRMDEDNAVARLKWCFDLLVERGWLVDDDPDHLTILPVKQRIDRDEKPRVIIQLADFATGLTRTVAP